jgi:hypothetical protein
MLDPTVSGQSMPPVASKVLMQWGRLLQAHGLAVLLASLIFSKVSL